jgi:hypothetical protein
MYSEPVAAEWLVISTVAVLSFLLGVHLLSMGMIGELCLRTGDYRPEQVVRPTLTLL